MLKKISPKILLAFILLISFVLRLANINTNPPSLNWDEVSHGYNAYSILKSGHDEWGQFMPITNFRAYGDYPTTLYMYLLIPIIAVFGLNDLTVRLPSAILGSLFPLLIYFLAKKIVKKEPIAIISSFLVALSPWSILLSRQALQATPAIFLMSLGILLFLIGLEKKNWFTVLGTFFLGLSTYAYHNTRIFVPILFLGLLIFFRKKLLSNLKSFVAIIFCFTLLFTPVFLALISSEGRARASWVSILDQGAINSINESRGNSALQPFGARLLHNKVTYFSKVVIKNYIGYFSPYFLATNGGSHYQFSIQGFGVINPLELPFFYLGLFLLLKNFFKSNKESRFLLFWLLTSPLPAIITRDSYQVVRVTTMMPAIYLTIVYGLSGFVDFIAKRIKQYATIIYLSLFLIFSFFTVKYLNNLYRVYPIKYSEAWQYGYKEAVGFVQDNYDQYEHIIFTKKYGEPHEFVLFFTRYDPAALSKDPNLVRFFRTEWYWTNNFDKYSFVNDWEIIEKSKEFHNSLLITSPENVPKNKEILKTINFLDGTPAFIIVSLP